MALSQTALSAAIFAALTKIQASSAKSNDPLQIQKEFADEIAKAVYVWVLTATVTVQPGIAVATTGGAGATTSPGTGNLL